MYSNGAMKRKLKIFLRTINNRIFTIVCDENLEKIAEPFANKGLISAVSLQKSKITNKGKYLEESWAESVAKRFHSPLSLHFPKLSMQGAREAIR